MTGGSVPVSKYDIDLVGPGSPNTSHWQVADLVGSAKRVLDVGCSTGYFAEALAARGNDVVGLEFDETSAHQARARGIEVLTGDLETMDLPGSLGEASFDVVVFADVLEHLRDPLPVLRATHRLLRPNGFVVISLPNIAHGDVRLALLDGRFDYTETGILDNTHTKFFTRRSLTRFVRDAGFAIAELRRTSQALFETELELDRQGFEPALIERVLADPDATTYQFILKAVADDAAASGLGLAERLYEAESERDRLRDEAMRLRDEVAHLREVAAQADRARQLAEQAAAESDTLQGELRTLSEEQQRRATLEIERLRYQRRRFRMERNRLRAQLTPGPQDPTQD
jgi:methionine biosynthesis protein MetW